MRASKAIYHPNGDATIFATVEETLDDIIYGTGGAFPGTTGGTDNALLRADGTGGETIQATGVVVDDSNNISVSGVSVPLVATAAQYRSDTSGAIAPSVANIWDAVEDVTLTDAASIAVDLSTGFNFTVSLGGNRTLANPTNAKPGQAGCFKATASGANRTLDIGANYVSKDITWPITITSGTVAYVFYFVSTSSLIIITAAINGPT